MHCVPTLCWASLVAWRRSWLILAPLEQSMRPLRTQLLVPGVEAAEGWSVPKLPQPLQSSQCSFQPGSLGLAGRAGWCGQSRQERLPEYSWLGMVWLGEELRAHPAQLSATFH